MRLHVLLLIALPAVGGCVSKSNEVRTRAAFDLDCPGEKLEVTPLTSEMMETATYGVRATFRY